MCVKLKAIVLVVLVYCSSYSGYCSIDCTPINDDTGRDVSCDALGENDPSCNRQPFFSPNEQRIYCFGDDVMQTVPPLGRNVNLETGYLNSSMSSDSMSHCPTPRRYHGGCMRNSTSYESSRNRVLNLSINYEPFNLFYYKVVLNWSYPSQNNAVAYSIMLSGPNIYDSYCVCIRNSSRNFTFYVKYPSPSDKNLIAEVFTFPYDISLDSKNFKTVALRRPPKSCADFRSIQYDSETCGLPLYNKPSNVIIQQINDTHTSFSWDAPNYKKPQACNLIEYGLSPPCTKPSSYYLTVQSNHFVIFNTTKVILNTLPPSSFQLYAYVPCSGFYDYKMSEEGSNNGCSGWAYREKEIIEDVACCVAPIPSSSLTLLSSSEPTISLSSVSSSTSLLSTVPVPRGSSQSSSLMPSSSNSTSVLPEIKGTSKASSHIINMVFISVGVGIAVAIIVFVLLGLWMFHRKKKSEIYLRCSISPSPSPPRPPSPLNTDCEVLVIYSPRTPENEERVIQQCLVGQLRHSYGINSSFVGLSEPRQNISDWISEHHERAHAVLCVCNQQFKEDWTSSTSDGNGSQVVRTFKLLFQGSLGSNKYAVILTRDSDSEYIPPLLKGYPTYIIVNCQGIARFAANIPDFSV